MGAFTTKFDIGDRIIMNRDASYIATVQRVIIASPRLGEYVATYEVSYFDASGTFVERSFYEWQLAEAI